MEIGAGPLGRLAIKFSGFARHITCLEKYPETVASIKKTVKKEGLKKKISVELAKTSKVLPFRNNSFDVVYGAWLPHNLLTDIEYLRELDRVSNKYILLIMPGINDDVVKMKELICPLEKQRREEYRKDISRNLKNLGYKISYKSESLKLNFPNKKTIRETFYCFDFDNKLTSEEKKKVNNYLDKKVHNIRDDFYCIIAEKK